MTCGVSWVDNTLNKAFFKLGIFIGRNPGYFLIVPVLLAILCMTGFQQIKYEIDPEYLFSPSNGEGKSERQIVEQYFKVNYTHRFNVGRITRAGRFGRVIITSKDADNNLLSSQVWQELRKLDDIIQNTTVEYDGDVFSYNEICARWEGECFTNDILNLDYILPEVESGNISLSWPIMLNPVSWDAHAFPVFFGGTKVSDDATYILSVPSLHLVYFVTADTKRQDAKGAAWEDKFLDTMGYYEDSGYFKHISISRFASRTLDHELEKNTRTVIPYFGSTFILMAIFSVLTCMMGDTVRSKPWLGLLGNISASMATAAAFGFAMYMKVEFIGINLAAPFLMIGIGIDDTFVMLAAWRRTSVKLSVPERMGQMMSEAAVSISITSLTDMISFWMGVFSPFPSVQIFCTYSALAVLFTYVWHVTFFAGCMAVFGYFEKRNLHGIFGCQVQPLSVAIKEKRSWIYRKFITGGINPKDPDNPIDNKDHIMMVFFRDHVARFINKGWVKVVIIFVFAAYLGGACYGLTKIEEGLERRKLSKADSYSVKFFDLEDEYYREFPYRIQVIITGDLNYSDPITQMNIETSLQQLENTSYVTSSIYTESWLRTYLSFLERSEDFLNISTGTEQNFIDSLKENWLYEGNPFSLDVKLNEDHTRILASRFLIQAINITDTNHEKQMVKDLRAICKSAPINMTIFHPYFVFFDQFELVRPTSVQCMVIGAVIMMIISFIFIPNVLCSIWITFSIISIEIGVVGYMSLWSVNLDSISMINLIMCIGFSIDFTAHICYCYMSSRCKLPSDRVREALYSLGLPIVQGSVSTILGVVALLLAESYIFLVFFKMVFLVIFFGAMHGLFLLPVMLSLFGPNSCSSSSIDDNQSVDGVMFQYKESKDSKIIPFSITHPHLMATPSSPNGIYSSKQFMNSNNFKFGSIDEKDLGIGTSSEDSSEKSSGKSQTRQALDDESVKRRYEMGWRKSSSNATMLSPCTFQPDLDIYNVNRYEDFWNVVANDNNPCNNRSNPRERQARPDEIVPERNRIKRNNSSGHCDVVTNRETKYQYYDRRRRSDESYRNDSSDHEMPRKYITTRRNIV